MPLGLLDRARPLPHHRRAARRGLLRERRRQPPGVAAALDPRRRETSIPCWTRRSRDDPELRGGSASTCTGASAASRPRPASTPPSTSRGTSATTRDRAPAHPGRRLRPDQRGQPRDVRPDPRRPAGRRAPCRSSARRPSTRRWSSTRWRPAPRRTIVGNVANRGLITNLPEGYCVEVPVHASTRTASPRGRGRAAGPARRGQPALLLASAS